MRYPRVALDLDGVTVDFQRGWIEAYEKSFGRKIPEEMIGQWDAFIKATHFTAEDFWSWTDAIRLWDDLPPVPGAQGGIFTLVRNGITPFFVTSRHVNTMEATLRWIQRHLPFLPFGSDVIFTKKKSSLAGHPFIAWVDDSPLHLADLVDAGVKVYRFAQPWNAHLTSIPAVTSWDHLTRTLLALTSETRIRAS